MGGRKQRRRKSWKNSSTFIRKASIRRKSFNKVWFFRQHDPPQKMQQTLEAPIMEAELRTAVTQGAHNKSPGDDGI
jgi:hypothetical protein